MNRTKYQKVIKNFILLLLSLSLLFCLLPVNTLYSWPKISNKPETSNKKYLSNVANEQIYSNNEDREIFNRYIQKITNLRYKSLNELIIATAKYFLGAPYVGHTLEKEPEGLVVNLREFDCTTFVESVLALSRTVWQGDATFEKFMEQLRLIRYRDGIINDYADRMHYTSDWIFENERKGIVKDMTKELGGKEYHIDFSFITSNTHRYKQLTNNPTLAAKIAEIEKRASQREYSRITPCAPDETSDQYDSGDIVCFVTTVKGLDISHLGFIYRDGKQVTFIHASSGEGKVAIEKRGLKDYVFNSKTNKGIMIVRPLSPTM